MILDTSVGAKWILEGEEDKDKAILLLDSHKRGKEQIIVPDLFFYEIANTIATKTELTRKHLTLSLKVIYKADLVVYHPTHEDILQTAKLAKEYRTSVYDMLYAVVAKKHNTILISADARFVKKTKFPHVKLLSEYSS